MSFLRSRHKLIVGVLLVVVVSVLAAYVLITDRMHDVQTYVDDAIMQSSTQTPDPRIVVVAIDDQSLKDFGRLGNWDRAIYGKLIVFLKNAGAKVVAFDVLFDLPTPRDPLLAQAIAYAQSSAGGSPPMPVILAADGDGDRGHRPGQGLAYDQFLVPSPAIMAGRPLLGNVTVDPDGAVVRHLPLRAVADNQHLYLLPFVAASSYLGRPALDQGVTLQPNGISALGRTVPTDPNFRMLIDYVGPPFAFPHLGLSKVVNGAYPASDFKDKLVLVGMMGATGLADDYPVPTSRGTKMWGVEIWANGAQNLLNGKFVAPEGELTSMLLMIGLGVIAAVGFFLWGAAGWFLAFGLVLAYSSAEFLYTVRQLSTSLTSAQLIPLPRIAYVDLDILLVAAALFIWFFIVEQRARRAIGNMFGKYLTPEVARLVIDQQERGELGLGGSVKTATIMFGDIRGFTTLSEGMEPEEVMGMLNRYFEGMVDIIVKHGGTISKFIGDNVMVLFNLPVESHKNHALAAARAGFEIQEWIQQYRADHPEEKAAFGFGISSGPLVAGNMGSEERMEYTVIGDPVREADELCATALANEVAISESTYALVQGAGVEVLDKGLVAVKGKTEQIHMYTVTGIVKEALAVA